MNMLRIYGEYQVKSFYKPRVGPKQAYINKTPWLSDVNPQLTIIGLEDAIFKLNKQSCNQINIF